MADRSNCCFANVDDGEPPICTVCGEGCKLAEPDNEWDAYGKAVWKERKLERRNKNGN